MVPYPHDRNLDASAKYFSSTVFIATQHSIIYSKLACFLFLEAPPINAKYILPSFALRMHAEERLAIHVHATSLEILL